MSFIDKHGYCFEKKDGKVIKRATRVWCEHFGKDKVPDGYVIHHINGDRLDDRIQNLQCVEDTIHRRYHNIKNYNEMSDYEKDDICLRLNIGREEWFDNLSENEKKERWLHLAKKNNTTGYYRVYKDKNKRMKQGFIWRYKYYDNGKLKAIVSVDIDKLKEKVLDKGLEWIEFND